jgi:hypothetical protein
MDVNPGFSKRLTHARQGAGTISKKDGELGRRLDGELGKCVHAVCNVTPGMDSDNPGKF